MDAPAPNPAPGETLLPVLIAHMEPTLSETRHVYLQLPHGTNPPETLEPLLYFREPEGVSLIVAQAALAAAPAPALSTGARRAYPCRPITLGVSSSLEAVGLMAAVTGRLARHGFSVIVVSTFVHDHLFVAEGQEAKIMTVLEDMMTEARLDTEHKE